MSLHYNDLCDNCKENFRCNGVSWCDVSWCDQNPDCYKYSNCKKHYETVNPKIFQKIFQLKLICDDCKNKNIEMGHKVMINNYAILKNMELQRDNVYVELRFVFEELERISHLYVKVDEAQKFSIGKKYSIFITEATDVK